MVKMMTQKNGDAPSQHIGNTVLVVTMEVDKADEAEFNKWYNDCLLYTSDAADEG